MESNLFLKTCEKLLGLSGKCFRESTGRVETNKHLEKLVRFFFVVVVCFHHKNSSKHYKTRKKGYLCAVQFWPVFLVNNLEQDVVQKPSNMRVLMHLHQHYVYYHILQAQYVVQMWSAVRVKLKDLSLCI